MKRRFAEAVSLLSLALLCACGGSNASNPTPDAPGDDGGANVGAPLSTPDGDSEAAAETSTDDTDAEDSSAPTDADADATQQDVSEQDTSEGSIEETSVEASEGSPDAAIDAIGAADAPVDTTSEAAGAGVSDADASPGCPAELPPQGGPCVPPYPPVCYAWPPDGGACEEWSVPQCEYPDGVNFIEVATCPNGTWNDQRFEILPDTGLPPSDVVIEVHIAPPPTDASLGE